MGCRLQAGQASLNSMTSTWVSAPPVRTRRNSGRGVGGEPLEVAVAPARRLHVERILGAQRGAHRRLVGEHGPHVENQVVELRSGADFGADETVPEVGMKQLGRPQQGVHQGWVGRLAQVAGGKADADVDRCVAQFGFVTRAADDRRAVEPRDVAAGMFAGLCADLDDVAVGVDSFHLRELLFEKTVEDRIAEIVGGVVRISHGILSGLRSLRSAKGFRRRRSSLHRSECRGVVRCIVRCHRRSRRW